MVAAGIRITGIPAMASTFSTVAESGTRCTIITVAIGQASGTNGIANIMGAATGTMAAVATMIAATIAVQTAI